MKNQKEKSKNILIELKELCKKNLRKGKESKKRKSENDTNFIRLVVEIFKGILEEIYREKCYKYKR